MHSIPCERSKNRRARRVPVRRRPEPRSSLSSKHRVNKTATHQPRQTRVHQPVSPRLTQRPRHVCQGRHLRHSSPQPHPHRAQSRPRQSSPLHLKQRLNASRGQTSPVHPKRPYLSSSASCAILLRVPLLLTALRKRTGKKKNTNCRKRTPKKTRADRPQKANWKHSETHAAI